MYRYRLYGFSVVSDLEFKQLLPETDDMPEAPEIYIGACEIPEEITKITDKKYEFGSRFSWLVNRTTYLIVEDGKKIGYSLKEGGIVAHLQSYILGFGMSMLAMQRGILAIHCSAVANESGAVLIAGESGAGKSTLTTAFLEKGYRLLADDMAFVRTVDKQKTYVYPAFPFQKLCRNVAVDKGYDLNKLIYINEDKDKFLVPYEGEFNPKPVEIKAFFMLGLVDGDEVALGEIQGIKRFYIYANNLFLRHLLGRHKYDTEIGQLCIEMAANVPTYCIARPVVGNTTAEVVEKVFSVLD